MQGVKFLGQLISKEGIKPDKSSIMKLKNIKNPKNRKQLMNVIGLIQWFRPYIKNHSKKLIPLTNKLKKKEKFGWGMKDTQFLDK